MLLSDEFPSRPVAQWHRELAQEIKACWPQDGASSAPGCTLPTYKDLSSDCCLDGELVDVEVFWTEGALDFV